MLAQTDNSVQLSCYTNVQIFPHTIQTKSSITNVDVLPAEQRSAFSVGEVQVEQQQIYAENLCFFHIITFYCNFTVGSCHTGRTVARQNKSSTPNTRSLTVQVDC